MHQVDIQRSRLLTWILEREGNCSGIDGGTSQLLDSIPAQTNIIFVLVLLIGISRSIALAGEGIFGISWWIFWIARWFVVISCDFFWFLGEIFGFLTIHSLKHYLITTLLRGSPTRSRIRAPIFLVIYIWESCGSQFAGAGAGIAGWLLLGLSRWQEQRQSTLSPTFAKSPWTRFWTLCPFASYHFLGKVGLDKQKLLALSIRCWRKMRK